MTIYFDTSALVKLYIWEPETPALITHIKTCSTVTTSVIAYAECRAAFARKNRESKIAPSRYRDLIKSFDHDWENSFSLTEVSESLVRMAGQLAEKHALRGFDAIHLASASTFQKHQEESFEFCAYDEKLNKAARKEGLIVRI